jgi:Zn ribbon nucleic-acid-binding protein
MDLQRHIGSFASTVQGNLYGISEDQRKFLSSGSRCPRCEEKLLDAWGLKYGRVYSSDGKQIPAWRSNAFNISSLECLKCGYRWDYRNQNIPRTASESKLLNILETVRTQEKLGDDKRIIDNSRSSASLVRRFSVSKEWTRAYRIEYEKIKLDGQEVSIGMNEGMSVKSLTEDSIRQHYSISEEIRENYTEEVEIEIPAFTKLAVIFQWKRLWQHGIIELNHKSQKIIIPFQIVSGITFDQIQHDAKNDAD